MTVPTAPSRPVAVAAAALLAAHLALVLATVLPGRPLIHPLHNDTVHRVARGDFYAVYHGAWLTRSGHSPFAEIPDGHTPYWYPYRYPPVAARLALPLTLLPPGGAYYAWVLVLEASLLAAAWTFWRRAAAAAPQAGGPRLLLPLALLMLSGPYLLEAFMGQFTCAVTAWAVLALAWGRRGWAWPAGLLIKPYALAATPALLRHRRLWAAAALGVAVPVLANLPDFLARPGDWALFAQANFAPTGGLDTGNFGLVRLMALAARDLGVGSDAFFAFARAFRWLGMGIVAALVLAARGRDLRAGVAALLTAHFLTYLHVWEHHLSAVVLLGCWLLADGAAWGDARRRGVLVVALVLLALPTAFVWMDAAKDPRVWDPSGAWPRWWLYALPLPKVLGTAGVCGVGLAGVLREGLRGLPGRSGQSIMRRSSPPTTRSAP